MSNNMVFSKLETAFRDGTTIIDNIFIHNFMPLINAEYVKVYLNGLMRCFGDKNSHFSSVETIAEDLDVSVRTVQRAYGYFERIFVHCPESEYADSDGNLYLVQRKQRWLRYSPSEIGSVSSELKFLKSKNKSAKLSEVELDRLESLQRQLNLMLYDYQSKNDDTYKYQSSNSIMFLTNLRGLNNDTIIKFINRIIEVNKLIEEEDKEKKKKRKNTKGKPKNKEENVEIADEIEDNQDKNKEDLGGVSPESPQGDDTTVTQRSTSNIIKPNNNNNIYNINQSSKEKNNNSNLDRLIELDKQIKNSGFKTYKELIDDIGLSKENFEYPYSEWINAITKAIYEMYYYDDTKVKGKRVGRYDVIGKLQNIEYDIIISTVDKVIKSSKSQVIDHPVAFIKSTLFNEIDEHSARIQAQFNYDFSEGSSETESSAPLTRFHNFEGRTSYYSEEELEEVARRKREGYLNKLKKDGELDG